MVFQRYKWIVLSYWEVLYNITTLSIYMKPIRVHQDDVVRILEEKGPVSTNELIKELQCSRSTLYVKLKEIPYTTSCNKNGKYHALQGIAWYDHNGLWYFGDIVFSKWGTLEDTIQHLVDSSKAGLSSIDLESILKTKITPQLVALGNVKRIDRVRYGRHHVYYSVNRVVKERQMSERNALIGYPKEAKTMMGKDKTIRVLATIVKHQTISFENAMEILSSEGIFVTDNELIWVFEKYGLKKRFRWQR